MMKVYELRTKDDGYDEGCEFWIAIPEGCNIEINDPFIHEIECRFLSQEECEKYGGDMMKMVDCIVHKDVAS